MRNGQISIFILLGALLLIIVGFLLLYVSYNVEKVYDHSQLRDQAYTESCLEAAGQEAVRTVGLYAGSLATRNTVLLGEPAYAVPIGLAGQELIEQNIKDIAQNAFMECMQQPFIQDFDQEITININQNDVQLSTEEARVLLAINFGTILQTAQNIQTIVNVETTYPCSDNSKYLRIYTDIIDTDLTWIRIYDVSQATGPYLFQYVTNTEIEGDGCV